MDPYAWAWDAETIVLVPLALAGYAVLLRRYPAPSWCVSAFLASQVLLVVAFTTPLETLSLHYLLCMHLLQNVVVAEWAPALFVLGLAPALARRVGAVPGVRTLTHPLAALPLWVGTYFAWHVPWIYDTALRHPHSLLYVEHATYFAAGVLVWWPVLQDAPRRLAPGARAGYLFAAFVLASPLGLLLALLPKAVYGFYASAPRLWGLSRLSDQEIAGVTMAVEQAIVFFALFTLFFLRFLREEEEERPLVRLKEGGRPS